MPQAAQPAGRRIACIAAARCLVGRIERLERQLGERDLDRGAEYGDGAEERQDARVRAQPQRHGDLVGMGMRRLALPCTAGICGKLRQQVIDPVVAGQPPLPAQPLQQMRAPFREICDQRRQTARMQAQAHDVDRWLHQLRIDTGEQRRHCRIGRDHGPCPVDRERRIGLVGLENEVDGRAGAIECGIAEGPVAEARRIAGGNQQGVALPQWHIELLGEVQHHLARRLRSPALDEAQVLLRDLGLGGERELAHMALRAPGTEQIAEDCWVVAHAGRLPALGGAFQLPCK